jgi:hypothetical protein
MSRISLSGNGPLPKTTILVQGEDDTPSPDLGQGNEKGDFLLSCLTVAIPPPYFPLMPRTARAAQGGFCYHVLNRGNARAEVFHKHYGSSGHVWQGRFKAFPIEQDEHFLTVVRYVERNPLRANLVPKAEDWRWSSLAEPPWLDPGPCRRPADWREYVNRPLTLAETERLRQSVQRGTPYGRAEWMEQTAARLGLEASLRPRGRPRKTEEK